MQLWSMREYVEGMEKAGLVNVGQRLISDPVKPSAEPTLCTFGIKP